MAQINSSLFLDMMLSTKVTKDTDTAQWTAFQKRQEDASNGKLISSPVIQSMGKDLHQARLLTVISRDQKDRACNKRTVKAN